METAKKITKIFRSMLYKKSLPTNNLVIFVPQMSRDHAGLGACYTCTCTSTIHKPPGESTIPKKMPKGRPIISDCNSASEKVAEYIDSQLKLKASQHFSYIKNTYDFFDKIKCILIPPNSLLITLDVESMYTNTLHEKALESITERFKSSYLDENVLE